MPVTVLDEAPSLGRLFATSLVPVRHRPSTLPDTTLAVPSTRIDRDALAAYQQVCGFNISDAVPATYLHVLAFPLATAIMVRRNFPFPLVGLVHVENSMTQHRRLTVDDELALSVHADNLRPHRIGRQVDLVAEARVHDELVWTDRSTYLRREKTSSSTVREPRTDAPRRQAAGRWAVPADIGRRYATVSGDRNPIHLRAVTAKAFGFPRAIAHGMWLHAHAVAAIAARLPDAYTADVRFKTPVLLPSTVAVSTAHSTDGFFIELSNARSGKPHMTLTTTAG
ncbi:MAG: MaoC family dehydratase [Jatrophihabitans sp.]